MDEIYKSHQISNPKTVVVQKDQNIKIQLTKQASHFSSLINNVNQQRHQKIQHYVDFSICLGLLQFALQVYQYLYMKETVYQNKFSEISEKFHIKQEDKQKTKNLNLYLQSVFLTLIFIFINAITKFLIYEDREVKRKSTTEFKFKQNRDILDQNQSRNQSIQSPGQKA